MVGVFISKGMTIGIPVGGLKIAIDNHGKITGPLTPHVRFDVGPTWIQLALRHLDDAKAKQDLRVAAWAGVDENQKSHSLEREFEASMQAIMAAAIAVDAFYSLIQTHVDLPPSIADKWRVKRTARYSQVTEVLKRAFHLKPTGVANQSTPKFERDIPIARPCSPSIREVGSANSAPRARRGCRVAICVF
jgi:hypothetical protein